MKKKQKAKRNGFKKRSSPSSISKKETSSKSQLCGPLKIHRDGYAFVLSEDPKCPDVFIPARRLQGAMQGDRVLAQYWKETGSSRLEGKVESILSRAQKFAIGRLERVDHDYYIRTDQNYQFRLDPDELRGAKLGDTLGIEIVQYPSEQSAGEGRVTQIFGARGDEKTEVDIIILKHGLPREFPEACEKEAKAIAEKPLPKKFPNRRDLRKLHFVTIDGETARDFDDAIVVQREKKNFRLLVSIADVSHYVTPGSALDDEAFARGTSVYFPDKVIPMLPEELSNNICSLRPHEDRLCFTAEILFDARGKVLETDFYRSVICSQARLTYRQVAQAMIQKDEKTREKIASSIPMLEVALELFGVLRRKRVQRGSIDFDLPEEEFIISIEEGSVENILKAERNEAHQLIEEFMIAANEAVAEFLTEKKVPALYRIHPTPDHEKLKNFETLLNNLGFNFKLRANPKPKDLSSILQRIRNHDEEKLLHQILLRSLKQAVYSPENEGHFGLASKCYTHFTSPIRRYPDLVVHRKLQEAIDKKETKKSKSKKKEDLAIIATHCSRRERSAMEAEWEAIDLKVALFMRKFLGETFKGIVSRITKFGFFVELETYFVEGLILLKEIREDYFIFEEKKHRLRGKRTQRVIKIGTEVEVKLEKIDLEERKIYFKLV